MKLETIWLRIKKPLWWIMMLFVVCIASAVGKLIAGIATQPDHSKMLSEIVTKAAQQINAQAPKQIDEITVLTKAEAVDGKILATHYTLKNFSSYEKNFDFQAARKSIVAMVCGKQGTKKQSPLANGMIHQYIYERENGQPITRFEVTKRDCPGLM